MRSDNPIVVRVRRGDGVESLHRGTWALVDVDGRVVDGRGVTDQQVYARSSSKSLQALPLVETGAADRYGCTSAELALALASHSGESVHIEVVAGFLERLGLDETALGCGPQAPFGAGRDAAKARIANNCSGKHAGFLAVALHLGQDPATYLDPDGPSQRAVRAAVLEMTGTAGDLLGGGIDGCSAPTFALPLRDLATGIARMATPDGLDPTRQAACRRLTDAAARHPELVAGTRDRICTDLLASTGGRLFAKTGAEAVYVVGVRGRGLGLVVKVDDGADRALHPLLVTVLDRLGLVEPDERLSLGRWFDMDRRNHAGEVVGSFDIDPAALPDCAAPSH